jgi:fumarylacetoacetase
VTGNWIGLADDDPYSLDNLPYGSGDLPSGRTVALARVGDAALDLTAAFAGDEHIRGFAAGTLDGFLAAGPRVWAAVRARIVDWLSDAAHRARLEPLIVPLTDVRSRLPFTVADYVDFYASEHHATNVGKIFRPDGQPLTPNWKHLPLGYHGRAGTVVVSGTEIIRPRGQYRVGDATVFGPSQRLDIEAEVGFVVGASSPAGRPVPSSAFRAHVFGLGLVNDWSARDLQAWESMPLGPFLGKSFATSFSAWVTPLAALDRAWTHPPRQDPVPLPYLAEPVERGALDLALEVRLNGELVSTPPFAGMYWTPAQLLAHLTVNGARLRTGDLYASGTVSGPARDQRGSLLELTWAGAQPLSLRDGSSRAFLADGDTVTISATAPGPHGRIALGEVTGRVVGSG